MLVCSGCNAFAGRPLQAALYALLHTVSTAGCLYVRRIQYVHIGLLRTFHRLRLYQSECGAQLLVAALQYIPQDWAVHHHTRVHADIVITVCPLQCIQVNIEPLRLFQHTADLLLALSAVFGKQLDQSRVDLLEVLQPL